MTTEKLFSERQHFKQIWLWVLLISINALFIYGLVRQVFLEQTFGDKPMSNRLLILLTSGALLLTLLFVFLRLDTVIQKDGVYYRFLPFQLTYKKISWDRISKSFVRQYNPIAEYGGWGIRIGIFGKGKAFNVSGNKGLQLVYDDGKKILLGTQRPEEIEQVLKQLGRLTNDN
ncbi:MAG: hypothetical protein JWN76_3269 [Chitinophagaceae bacterium]|nr:hypothetical protein [Chitinophagaceae bacterium]